MVLDSSTTPEPNKPQPVMPEPATLEPAAEQTTPESMAPESEAPEQVVMGRSPDPMATEPLAAEPIAMESTPVLAASGPAAPGPGRKEPGAAKRFLLSALIAVLGIGTVVNGGLLLQSNEDLEATDSGLTALQNENSALQGSIAEQQAAAGAILADIAVLQQTISKFSAVPTGQTGADFTALATLIEPSTVFIQASSRQGGGTGSGTIIRADGYVLTNNHVIDGATTIRVTLKSGDTFTATVLTSNADLDVAVLKLSTTRTNLPAAKLGSSAAVVVGQEVLACGFPLGEELPGPASFNSGIVSAIRNMVSSATENPAVKLDYIQIDADINPGNSGGGLFNLNAELIGIPSYGFATGINTAIPIDAALPLIQSAYAK